MARKNPIVHLEGADELNDALRALGDRTTGLLLRKAAEAGAAVLVYEAKRLAPKDTGALAEGIKAEVHRLQNGRAQINIAYSSAQWYGALVEAGTDKMAAQPFLRPALDTKSQEASDAVADVLREALESVLS